MPNGGFDQLPDSLVSKQILDLIKQSGASTSRAPAEPAEKKEEAFVGEESDILLASTKKEGLRANTSAIVSPDSPCNSPRDKKSKQDNAVTTPSEVQPPG